MDTHLQKLTALRKPFKKAFLRKGFRVCQRYIHLCWVTTWTWFASSSVAPEISLKHTLTSTQALLQCLQSYCFDCSRHPCPASAWYLFLYSVFFFLLLDRWSSFLKFPTSESSLPPAFSSPPYPSGSRMRKQEVEAIMYRNLAAVQLVYRLKSPYLSYF